MRFETNCKRCNRRIEGEHCVFLPTLSTYVVCPGCGLENVVPFYEFAPLVEAR